MNTLCPHLKFLCFKITFIKMKVKGPSLVLLALCLLQDFAKKHFSSSVWGWWLYFKFGKPHIVSILLMVLRCYAQLCKVLLTSVLAEDEINCLNTLSLCLPFLCLNINFVRTKVTEPTFSYLSGIHDEFSHTSIFVCEIDADDSILNLKGHTS